MLLLYYSSNFDAVHVKNYKNQQGMKEKMDKLKPEMDAIQQKLKAAKTKEEQMALQQEMMGLYEKYDVNPMNMGCLPVIIQMPVIMGLYYAIRYSLGSSSTPLSMVRT